MKKKTNLKKPMICNHNHKSYRQGLNGAEYRKLIKDDKKVKEVDVFGGTKKEKKEKIKKKKY
tara:strand:+ start:63 stop:248 length:186 start_codon:yes stop_codon:yes gene_type:complete